jgi:lipopolysaccharide heptosyltransferase I
MLDLTAADLSAIPPALPGFQRLLIVRLGSMGDILHTLPAATALRNEFPDASLGWLVEERWAELLCASSEPRHGPRSARRPLVDRVHTVNTKTWRKDLLSMHTWERIAAAMSELRAPRYEVAMDFQGAARSALLARFSGAPVIFGFRQPRENVASMLYTRQVAERGTHVVEQNLSLAEAVAGRSLKLPKPELPRDDTAQDKWARWLKQEKIGPFVLLNPGAGWGAKQWPPERYGQVARTLAGDGLKSLVNFGPGEESLARAVETASQGSARAVGCSLPELIALVGCARLFIGGDTGPLHLAATLGIPTVAIFGPTNPARNGPFGTRSVVLRSPSSQTSHARRARPDPGLLEISADKVIRAARELLRQDRG